MNTSPSLAPGPTSLAPASLGARSEEQTALAASGALLAAVYRLFKVARMYDSGHQLLRAETDLAATAIAEFCTAVGSDSADMVFVGETVFVNGQMPRFSRDAYARAMELAALLDRCGISNLTIAKTVTPHNVLGFVTVVADVLRDASRMAELTNQSFPAVRARRLRAKIGGDAAELDQSPVARVVRTYACAIVVLRGFYASLAKEQPKLPAALRRVAQRFVTHSEQEPVLLVGLAAGQARERDEATVATGTALVAVLMARQLTTDRNALTSLTLAALLHDVGRQEIFKATAGDALVDASLRTLSEDDQDRLAGSTVLGMTTLDRIEPTSVSRAVVAFEAQWLRRTQRLGAMYRGKRTASTLARILAVARSFCELMAPGPYTTPMAAEDAIQFLSSRATDEQDRTYVKLLTGALGIFPPGTTVEFNTREIGVVTSVPDRPVDFSRPPVRVMYDSNGNKLDPPLDVDLAAPLAPGQPQRMIQRTFDADQQQAQAMRAYVLAVTSGDRNRKRQAAPPPQSSPSADSRSGKRPAPAREGAPQAREAPAPAFDDRPPTGVGLDSRRRVEAFGAPAFEERPPTGAGLESRPRIALFEPPPASPGRPGRPKTGVPTVSAFPAVSDVFKDEDVKETTRPPAIVAPPPPPTSSPALYEWPPKSTDPGPAPTHDPPGLNDTLFVAEVAEDEQPTRARPSPNSSPAGYEFASDPASGSAFDAPGLENTLLHREESPIASARSPRSSPALEDRPSSPSRRGPNSASLLTPSRRSVEPLPPTPSGRLPAPLLEQLQAIEELPLLEEIPADDVPPVAPIAPPRVSIPAAADSQSGPVSRRGAWKARQAERAKFHDPRAERDSDRPPRAPTTAAGAAPPSIPNPTPSQPSVSPRSVPDARLTARAMPRVHTAPTQPKLQATVEPAVRQDQIPTPPSRPAARVAAATTAGTRKANWSDYGDIVDEATPPPYELTPPPHELAPAPRSAVPSARSSARDLSPAPRSPPSGRDLTPAPRSARDLTPAPRSARELIPEPPLDLTPAPSRPLPKTRAAVAGTRKVTWGDYDELVDELVDGLVNETGATVDPEPPPDPPSSGTPNMTRRATWEEAAELARLTDDDSPPEDEGI